VPSPALAVVTELFRDWATPIAVMPRGRSRSSLAAEAHIGARHRGDTVIAHPIQVAGLLAEAGYDQGVVAAGLLHTVVTLSRAFPGLPFLDELQIELNDLVASHPANGRYRKTLEATA
jgi:hypothetical protein